MSQEIKAVIAEFDKKRKDSWLMMRVGKIGGVILAVVYMVSLWELNDGNILRPLFDTSAPHHIIFTMLAPWVLATWALGKFFDHLLYKQMWRKIDRLNGSL